MFNMKIIDKKRDLKKTFLNEKSEKTFYISLIRFADNINSILIKLVF